MEIILLLAGLAFYFLPSFIGRHKSNSSAIFLLNLLLGWTLIGWIVSLVWASTNDTPAPKVIVQQAAVKPADIDAYARLKQLRDQGILTQEEFMQQVGNL